LLSLEDVYGLGIISHLILGLKEFAEDNLDGAKRSLYYMLCAVHANKIKERLISYPPKYCGFSDLNHCIPRTYGLH